MATRPVNVLSLCSGVGGLELGAKLALGDARVVCYVEREAFCVEHLARKGEAGALDAAPVWSDLASFDGRPWCGVVDLVTAGFPCQPFSQAGTRKGTEDERWLWPELERIIQGAEPGVVFLENVPGLVRSGLASVLQGLAWLGFDAEWDVFSAAGVGAPHIRKRLFILAAHSERDTGWLQQGRRCWSGWPGEAESGDDGMDGDAADADGSRPPRSILDRARFGSEPGAWDQDARCPEPTVRRVADGPTDRVDRLRACGNGVVPLVAAHALRTLAART